MKRKKVYSVGAKPERERERDSEIKRELEQVTHDCHSADNFLLNFQVRLYISEGFENKSWSIQAHSIETL